MGHPGQLYEWAMMDAGDVNTVVAASFKRAWRARKDLERSLGYAQTPRLETGDPRLEGK